MSDADNNVSGSRKGGKLRRGHKKVKTGCTDCRRRRVKVGGRSHPKAYTHFSLLNHFNQCTEERPRCRACERRGAQCEYPSSSQIRSLSAGPSPASYQSHGPSPQPHQHISPLPGLSSILREESLDSTALEYSIRDMALLHHWTISTSHHIYKDSVMSLTFQVTVPQIAFKHKFVMHILLSLTALHIAYLEPQERLRHAAEASHYHNLSLQGFNEAMKQDREKLADALFTWASINLLYVFGVTGRLGQGLWDESEWGNRKERLLGLGWVPMIRGVEMMLKPSFFIMREGPLRELLMIGNYAELDVDNNPHPDDHYFCQTRDVWTSNPDAQTYEDTMQVLRRCHIFMEQFKSMESESPDEGVINRSFQGAFLFVPFAPEAYFTLLQQRQPPALILYAFYGALLHRFVNGSWFMEGWGYDIVEIVSDLLGSYWRKWITWPLQVVGLIP
ncbi:hypothetical protein FLONG3_3570 [Fusarium longipes]|uniref:Zn(2)-C6 fungal-type domain-containing protein n=1 Tax=Fusarium longipes TaxID=694270 RepID=A0A395T206_9HYPO|nr:hypothetical protein FLONG3_3570 [Fusarium longipes]